MIVSVIYMAVINPVVIQPGSIFDIGINFGPNNLADYNDFFMRIGPPHPSGSTVITDYRFHIRGDGILSKVGWLEIAEGWTEIGQNFFNYYSPSLSNLRTIKFPTTVKKLASASLRDARTLRQIYNLDNVEEFGSNCLMNIGQDTQWVSYIRLGENVKTVGSGAFDGCHVNELDLMDLGASSITNNFKNIVTGLLTLPRGIANLGSALTMATTPEGYKLAKLWSPRETPPTWNGLSSFLGIDTVIYIPFGATAAYSAGVGAWPTDPARYTEYLFV